jgi:hypothetical protein
MNGPAPKERGLNRPFALCTSCLGGVLASRHAGSRTGFGCRIRAYRTSDREGPERATTPIQARGRRKTEPEGGHFQIEAWRSAGKPPKENGGAQWKPGSTRADCGHSFQHIHELIFERGTTYGWIPPGEIPPTWRH